MTRFDDAVAAIDRANRDDPHTIRVNGRDVPKELTHAEMATRWVRSLDPDASEAQLLAARAHHLRRWVVPRDSFPDGRKGYLRWRTEQKKRHATELGDILSNVGYDREIIERVQAIIRKEGLGADPDVQTHEDALCLVFLETQLGELVTQIGDDRSAEVLRKTLAKMSEEAIEAAGALDLGHDERSLLASALA